MYQTHELRVKDLGMLISHERCEDVHGTSKESEIV